MPNLTQTKPMQLPSFTEPDYGAHCVSNGHCRIKAGCFCVGTAPCHACPLQRLGKQRIVGTPQLPQRSTMGSLGTSHNSQHCKHCVPSARPEFVGIQVNTQ